MSWAQLARWLLARGEAAVAQDASWFVRVTARAAGPLAVDGVALQALADDAIARPAGIA